MYRNGIFMLVIRDYEQEACFILMLWALAIMGFKGYQSWQENNLLNTDILKTAC